MFTQRNTENERGALMLEAIALLGLMSMMSPMVVRQAAERTSEMEEVAVAGQMKELQNALSNYIEANYGSLTGNKTQNVVRTDISANDLAPFLSPVALEGGGNTFRGNKMVFNGSDSPYKIAARAECTESKQGGTTTVCTPGNCANLGVEGRTCNRYRITGIVLSNGGEELDDRRAARIASMIGADGGYMRSTKANNAISATNDDRRKIYGSQGIWEGETSTFFDASSNIAMTQGGRIAATTVFTTGASGDFLYRTQQDGIPGANSMFTDLDMGGNDTDCGSAGHSACRKVNNAGGLEIVNGRILVRSSNNGEEPAGEGEIGNAAISLAADASFINTGSSNLSISNDAISFISDSGTINLRTNGAGQHINIHSDLGAIEANARNLNLKAAFYANLDSYFINTTSGYLNVYASSRVEMSTTNMYLNSSNHTYLEANKIDLNTTTQTNLSSDNTVFIRAGDYPIPHVHENYTSIQLNKNTLNMRAKSSSLILNGGYGNYGLYATTTWGAGNNSGKMYFEAYDSISAVAGSMDDGASSIDMDWEGIHMTSDAIFGGGAGLDLNNDTTLELSSYSYGGLNITSTQTSLTRKSAGYSAAEKRKNSALNLTNTYMTQQVFNNSAGINLSNNAYKLHIGRSFYSNGVANDSALAHFNLVPHSAEWSVENARLRLDNQGLHLYSYQSNQPSRIVFHTGSNTEYNAGTAGIVMTQLTNLGTGSNMRALVLSDADLNNGMTGENHNYDNESAIAFYARTGRVDAGWFQVRSIHNTNAHNTSANGSEYWLDPIRTVSNMSVSENGQFSESTSTTNQYAPSVFSTDNGFTRKGAVYINYHRAQFNEDDDNENSTDPDTIGLYKPYENAEGLPDRYKNFRVDPAFISLMNDIRLTSRGSAKLSQALPNYILKGIYILTNSYTNGGWPCGDGFSKCSYNMPYFTAEKLGLGRGGYEFHCTGDDIDAGNPHPMQGTCTDHVSDGYVEFGFDAGAVTYSEYCNRRNIDDACWAHPFMGVVPAPGKKVMIKVKRNEGATYDVAPVGSEILAAHDEGPCPDGYQAVMTVTPTIFEMGKINAIRPNLSASGQYFLANPGYQNFMDQNVRKFMNIYQMGTKVGIITTPLCKDNFNSTAITSSTCLGTDRTLFGWAIAMGTVTQDNTDPGHYIWNVGGVYTNSWQATAHTYCYFNPARFAMPNMRIHESRYQTSSDNPTLNSAPWKMDE